MYYYPYGCTEQTSSRMISLLSLPLPESMEWTKKAPREIQEGVYQLYSLQHYDGGWGWWNNDDSNLFNTAHAFLALIMARDRGYLVTDNVIQQAKQYLMNIGNDSIKWEKAFGYFVLNQAGEKMPDLNQSEIDKTIVTMTEKELAWLSLVTDGDVHQKLQKELVARAQPVGDALFYGHSNPEKPWEDDRFLTTCWAVMALHREYQAIAGKAFLWLLRTIQSDWYVNTIEKAYFMKVAALFWEKSAVVSSRYRLTLNSGMIEEGQFEPQALTKKVDLDVEKLRTGENQIELQGEGIYLMTVKVRGFTSTTLPPSTLTVDKSYWKLKPVKTEDKSYVFIKEPFTSIQPGDELVCEILIDSPAQFDNLVIEDGMAAGFEFIRNDYVYQLQNTPDKNQPHLADYVVKKIYDQLPVLFVSRIEEGKNMIRYYLRVRDVGTFYIRPTQAYLMYFPEVRGYTKEHVFESGR